MQLRGFIFFIIDLLSPLSSLLSYFPTPSPFFLILFPAMQYTCKCYMQCAKNHLWQHCLHLHSPHTSLQQPMYSVCTSTSKLQPVHIAYIVSTINYGRNSNDSYILLICTPSFPGKFFTLIISCTCENEIGILFFIQDKCKDGVSDIQKCKFFCP